MDRTANEKTTTETTTGEPVREASGRPVDGGRRAHLLAERIADFVATAASERLTESSPTLEQSFEQLALEVFALQYEEIPSLRRLCRARGVAPGTVRRWREIPPVPVMAFKTIELRTAPAREVFRSSGTTGGPRSVHYHPFPELYRKVIEATFPRFCLVGLDRPPILALVPPRAQISDSSLGFMIDHVVRRWGGPDSRHAFGPAGVELGEARRWLERRRQDRRPALVIATSFALGQWLEALEEERPSDGGDDRAPILAPGSVVFDTGGFKGRTRELDRATLERWVFTQLGVPAERQVREYGMTELTSQLYTRRLLGGDGEHFVGPPWLRPRVLDPETLDELPPGRRGVVAFFDLANVGSVAHIVTQDLGRFEDPGLRLEGRANEAELRGCSLTVEELIHGSQVG